MRQEHLHYAEIESWFQKSVSAGSDFLFDTKLYERELNRLWDKFDVPFEVSGRYKRESNTLSDTSNSIVIVVYQLLQSFLRNVHVIHVKRQSSAIKKSLGNLADKYMAGSTIVELAKKENFPPYLLARWMVETITSINSKSALTEAMREPATILDPSVILPDYEESESVRPSCSSDSSIPSRISLEVQEAINADPMYGPLHDRERHTVGVEFEVVLEHLLSTRGLPFESEAELRSRGTAKTPDVLLTAPLGVPVRDKDGNEEWKVVCWIDSKALFGDVQTHQTSVLPQAETYLHRFGPGMIIYWFGHAPLERLDDAQGDLVIQGWELPTRLMLPTGDIVEPEAALIT
jgi:hypothetical protein